MFGRKKNNITINSSLAARIPYTRCFNEEGIIQSKDGRYTKMYLVEDIKPENISEFNSKVAQQKMAILLDAFPVDVNYQFLVHNKLIDQEKYVTKIIIDPNKVSSELKAPVEEYNSVILDNTAIGHNNAKKTLYFIVSIKADVVDDAINTFRKFDSLIKQQFSGIYGITVKGLTLAARLKVMYTIMNPERNEFGKKIDLAGDGDIDLKNLKYMHMTTKDIVAPDNWNTSNKLIDYSILNDKTDKKQFTRSFFIVSIPRQVSASFVSDLTNVSSNMVFSLIYEPVDSQFGLDAATKLVKDNTTVIYKSKRDTIKDRRNREKTQIEELKTFNEQTYFDKKALDTFKDAVARSQKSFNCSLVITLFNETEEGLDKDTELLHISVEKFSAHINSLDMQQCQGLQTCLPLCYSALDVSRILSVEKLAVMSPIGVQDAIKKDGLYFGLNSINDNLVLLNRKNNTNLTGLISGTEHSGKTYQMKREIFNALISTKDIVNVITFNDEYDDFAKKLNGVVLSFGLPDITKTNQYYSLTEDRYFFKSYFVEALIASLQSNTSNNDEYAKQIEDETTDIISHMKNNDIIDLFDYISKNYPDTAKVINNIKAKYINNKMPTVDDSRLVIYKVNNTPELLMTMDYLWDKAINDKQNNISNWINIDAADELAISIQSTDYFVKYMQNCSLFQTILTFILQDSAKLVNDTSCSVALESIVENCGYIKLLNLGPIERQKYIDLLDIPSALIQYISDVEPGKGIIITSSSNIAFNDNYSELYPESKFKDYFSKDIKQITLSDHL